MSHVGSTVLLVSLGSDAYEVVLGVTHPVASTAAVLGLGFAGWIMLARASWIPTKAGGLEGYGPALAFGLVLPIPVILVDYLGGFPVEINAPFPDAILFLPVHRRAGRARLPRGAARCRCVARETLPDARPHLGDRGARRRGLDRTDPSGVWGAGESPIWANAYVGFHLLLFNGLGLYVLRRYGILRAFSYRLSYYLVWHIGWGYVRLGLSFSV